jgi:hypothetical protein
MIKVMEDEYGQERDEYRELRDQIFEENGGVCVESTDDGVDMAIATYPPADIRGPIVTVAGRGILQPDGGTEAAQPTIESHERLVPGRELKDDQALYRRRAAAFAQQRPDFSAVVSREDIRIPATVAATVYRLRNGPEFAFFLGQNPGVASDLSGMDPLEASILTREMARALENDELPQDVSGYAEYRAAMNRREQLRQSRRARNG